MIEEFSQSDLHSWYNHDNTSVSYNVYKTMEIPICTKG